MIKAAMKNNVLPIFIFDGPPENLKRAPNPELVQRAQQLYNQFRSLESTYDREIADELSSYPSIRLYFASYHLKELCQAIGIPGITSPSEAEMAAAALCRDRLVGTVLSNDVDAILFGSPHASKSMQFNQQKMVCVTQLDILQEIQLDLNQLRDLAILNGCDFHKGGLKGIGPRRGGVLLRRHGSLERVLKAKGLNKSERQVFLHAREIFDQGDFIDTNNYDLSLNAPISSRLIKMLKPLYGQEWAEKYTTELISIRKQFGHVQATLEIWY
jgi:flap endonuclease-1